MSEDTPVVEGTPDPKRLSKSGMAYIVGCQQQASEQQLEHIRERNRWVRGFFLIELLLLATALRLPLLVGLAKDHGAGKPNPLFYVIAACLALLIVAVAVRRLAHEDRCSLTYSCYLLDLGRVMQLSGQQPNADFSAAMRRFAAHGRSVVTPQFTHLALGLLVSAAILGINWKDVLRVTNGIGPHSWAPLIVSALFAVWEWVKARWRMAGDYHVWRSALSGAYGPTSEDSPPEKDAAVEFTRWDRIRAFLGKY